MRGNTGYGEMFDRFLELSDMSSVFRILSRFEYLILRKLIKKADMDPENNGRVYLEEIKRDFNIPMVRVSEVVQAISDEGLLAWKLDSATQKTYVEITEQGREKCLLQREGMKKISDRIDNELSEEEKNHIVSGLLKFGRIVNEEQGETDAFFELLSEKATDNMNVIGLIRPKNTVSYLEAECSIEKSIKLLYESKYTTLPVVDEAGIYIGTVSDGDFLWYINDHGMDALNKVYVRDIVNKKRNPAVHDFDDTRTIINNIMEQNFLCMVDDRGCFIGIITRKDVIKYMKKRIESRII